MLVIVTLVLLFPVVFMFTNSFMNEKEVITTYNIISSVENIKEQHFISISLIPESVGLTQYYKILFREPTYLVMFWNSVIITLPIILGQVFVSALGGYAFAKLKFPFRNQIFFLFIIVMLMPFQVTLVSNYIVLNKMDLIGSYLSIILPSIFSTFGVFLLRQFIRAIPDEYCESAKIDGAGHFVIFKSIIIPQCKTGISSLAILSFIDNWNMVEQPLIFLKDTLQYPMSIFLSEINASELGIAFACGILYMLPAILIYLYGEEYLVLGIQLSGIK